MPTRMSFKCARTPVTLMSCCVRSPMGRVGRQAARVAVEESLRAASSVPC